MPELTTHTIVLSDVSLHCTSSKAPLLSFWPGSPSFLLFICMTVHILHIYIVYFFQQYSKHSPRDTHTLSVTPIPSTSQPRATVYHFPGRPHSRPADPLLGAWQCQPLMSMTSSVTMSPLPPRALLSIVRLTVSGLVLAEDGAGVARFLCK